jgi:hypothetical protein
MRLTGKSVIRPPQHFIDWIEKQQASETHKVNTQAANEAGQVYACSSLAEKEVCKYQLSHH